MSMYVGEALAGEGNEVAHIDLLIGNKEGPVGVAFAKALADQKQGHSNLLAVLTPNLLCKPATVLVTKVTIKGAPQAVQKRGRDNGDPLPTVLPQASQKRTVLCKAKNMAATSGTRRRSAGAAWSTSTTSWCAAPRRWSRTPPSPPRSAGASATCTSMSCKT